MVLGSWKRTAMDDLVAESVADAVVRAAWCDVLVVRPKEDADAVLLNSAGQARVERDAPEVGLAE
ncbi:MAG TPA: universal stress protein [Polyangia bacterium]|nr:universal stress protein [Polyangia bacterium]